MARVLLFLAEWLGYSSHVTVTAWIHWPDKARSSALGPGWSDQNAQPWWTTVVKPLRALRGQFLVAIQML